ncbi:MAG TPA: hypothetical protein VMM38_01515 [Aridibacter sp.]|nr:hypothetical protein [Aridibacter sp.]
MKSMSDDGCRPFLTKSKLVVFLYLLNRTELPAERIDELISEAQAAELDKVSLDSFGTGLTAHYQAKRLINRRRNYAGE